MKKISNTIRIGMVPKRNISPKLNEKHSPPNLQEQLVAKNSHPTSNIDPFHDVRGLTSPNTVRLHEMNEIHPYKNQSYTNNGNFHQALSPTRHQQETVSELYQVPSKTKKLTTKKILLGVAIAVVVASLIAVGVALGVVLTRTVDTTAASSTSPTTIAPTVISAVWPFDNITTELYGIYNGSMVNGASYSNATSQTSPYFGSGQALLLQNGLNQSFTISSPFLPLNFTSFTIETWIFPTSLSSDRGIFGQCQCPTCANQCLYFICRGARLFIGFTLNDLSGSTTLATNTWHHVAFVYNYETRQQILYVNGVQDTLKSNAVPYQGTNGSIQIGSTQVFGTTNFFSGFIDNLWVTTRAKSVDEILRDASLVVYFSFDLANPNADNGPNKLSGTPLNTITVSGRVNQAMRFPIASSYFQMYGLFQVPSGMTTNRPFSVSLWINPTVITSCTFVQLLAIPLSSCSNLLGIISTVTSTGQIFVQSANSISSTLTGPYVTSNVWTHISVTYSLTNGFTLYFNGNYFGATGTVTYLSSGMLTTLIIGYSSPCSGGGQNVAYQGAIDEVYIHNRQLTQAEVTALANP